MMSKRQKNKGFTLVEMVLVFALVAVFAIVVTFRQSDFRGRISLEQATSDMVLFLQTTQAEASTASDESLSGRRGVNIVVAAGGSATVLRFKDSNRGSAQYRFDTRDDQTASLSFPAEVTVKEFCVQETGQSWVCTDEGTVDVAFERSVIKPVVTYSGSTYDLFSITLEEDSGSQSETILINESGVVYVQ